MQFSPAAFNQFLGENGNIGQLYNWFQSYACPCVDPHSGQSKPSCPLCFGKGRQYSAPVEGVAALAGQKVQREWAQSGVYEQGDIVVTIPEDTPVYDMGQFDRITALNATQAFSLILTSGDPDLERLFTPVEVVTRVFWLNPAGTAVVEGTIPDVAADGTLTWPDGDEPPAGVQYTISGRKFLDYYCFGMFPTNRNMQQGLRLPRKVILRDYDLFNR